METVLTDAEVRVLGSLVEKQLTTPEYYPLTLNALTNACNQINNRDPVVRYDDGTVVAALDGLRAKGFAHVVYASNSRVPKYKHTMMDALAFTRQQELAVMCVLLLRGPQTPGEIRSRTDRLFSFRDLSDVEAVLEGLMAREAGALVMRLPRMTGQKEARYAHLLAGEVKFDESEAAPRAGSAASSVSRGGGDERVARLEEEMASLRGELSELRALFDEFRRQFE